MYSTMSQAYQEKLSTILYKKIQNEKNDAVKRRTLTTDAKLSSKIIISELSLATSVP